MPKLAKAPPVSVLCHCLSEKDQSRALVHDLLTADRINWQSVFLCAGHHLVTPALATALKWKGLYSRLGAEERDYLDTIQMVFHERNRFLRGELARAAAALNDAGVYPVLLKGAATLVPDQYPGAEDRIIGDFDLLIPDGKTDIAQTAMLALGYEEHDYGRWLTKSEQADGHHAPCLTHPSAPLAIELHRRILADKEDSALLSVHLLTQRITLENGAIVLLPDPATRLLHNMLHAQISDGESFTRALNLRQLLEFSRLADFYRDHIDVADLLSRLRPHRRPLLCENWAKAERWLGLAYPASLPRSRRQDVNSGSLR